MNRPCIYSSKKRLIDSAVLVRFSQVRSGGRVVSVRRRVHKPFCVSLEQLCEEYYLFRRENINVRVAVVDAGTSSTATGTYWQIIV